MRKAVGVILLIFVLSLIVYVLFFNTARNGFGRDIYFVSEGNMHETFSIKQIDSLSADLNYSFTIKNKVVHPVSPDSILVPQKVETPAG